MMGRFVGFKVDRLFELGHFLFLIFIEYIGLFKYLIIKITF